MSYCSFSQAMPDESELYRLLKEDRAVELLLISLWNQGGRPLDLHEMQIDEMEECLDHTVESYGFEDRAHVDRTFARLDSAIQRTCQAHPGLMERSAFIENVHS